MDNRRRVQIARTLIMRGGKVLKDHRRTISFAGNAVADEILNDIESYPHIFVLGCIADRRIPGKAAWYAAYKWCRRVVPTGQLTFMSIENGIRRRGRRIRVKCRYPITTTHFYDAVSKIRDYYEGHAERIWQGNPVAATVVRRFREFNGVGPKIANMATHILLRDFKVPLQKKHTIDMPVDGNVIRVFKRLGLISQNAPGNKQADLIIYTARELCPDYPAVFDTCVWPIGNQWCHGGRRRPDCLACEMRDLCRAYRR